MYYRNANCAVVVYDITQAVRSKILLQYRISADDYVGITRQGEGLGKGASAPSQREHCHRPCWKQSRSCRRTTRQACRTCRRCRGVRQRSQSSLLRDLRKDLREREGAVHRNRKEAADRAGQSERHARCWRQARWCRSWQERGRWHRWRRWRMPVLDDLYTLRPNSGGLHDDRSPLCFL